MTQLDGTRLDFDPATLPWLDNTAAAMDRYIDSLDPTPEDPETLRRQLLMWSQFGFVIMGNAIEHELIDAYLADLDQLFHERDKHRVILHSSAYDHTPINEYPRDIVDALAQGKDEIRTRVVDFHNYSIAAKKLSMHKSITGFLEHVFQDRIVGIQSLTFFKGSQQVQHQDFAFVPAHIPSHLAATWIALEDIHPDAGPLAYIPASHTFPKFDWGDGIYRTPNSTATDQQFADHLHREAEKAGLPLLTFCPKKGDVFF